MAHTFVLIMLVLLLLPILPASSMPSRSWHKELGLYVRENGNKAYLPNLGSSVTSDDEGNAYIAGIFSFPDSDTAEAFLVKYDKGGNPLWVTYWPVRFEEEVFFGSDIFSKPMEIKYYNNYIYAAGRFPPVDDETSLAGYLAKFRADDGQLIWFYIFNLEDSHDYETYINPYSLDVVNEGGKTEIYVAGSVKDVIHVSGNPSYQYEAFIAKFTDEGSSPSFSWMKSFDLSTTRIEEFRSVRVEDNMVFTGGVLNVDEYVDEGTDTVIAAFSLNGDLLWGRAWGGDQMDAIYSVIPSETSVYVVGQTSSIEGREVSSRGLILRYDLSGNFLSGKLIDTGNDTILSSGIYASDDLIFAGISIVSENAPIPVLLVDMTSDLEEVKWSVYWEDLPMVFFKIPYSMAEGNGSLYLTGMLFYPAFSLTEDLGFVPVELNIQDAPDLGYGSFYSGDLSDHVAVRPAPLGDLSSELYVENIDLTNQTLIEENDLLIDTFLLKMILQNVTLTVNVKPAGAGTTTPPVGSYSLPKGATVHITATPSRGYKFDHWTIDGARAGNSPTIEVEVDSDHVVQAVFRKAEKIKVPTLNELVFMDFPQGFRYMASESDFKFNRDLLSRFLGPALPGQRSKMVILGGPYIYRFIWLDLGVKFLKENGYYNALRLRSGSVLRAAYGHEDYGVIYVDSTKGIVRLAGITKYGTRAALLYLLNNQYLLKTDGLKVVMWKDLNGDSKVNLWEIEQIQP